MMFMAMVAVFAIGAVGASAAQATGIDAPSSISLSTGGSCDILWSGASLAAPADEVIPEGDVDADCGALASATNSADLHVTTDSSQLTLVEGEISVDVFLAGNCTITITPSGVSVPLVGPGHYAGNVAVPGPNISASGPACPTSAFSVYLDIYVS